MRLGPLTDLYGTPGAPKRARFGPERPFWGPGGPHGAPGGQIWCQLPPIVPPGLDSWPPHTLTWYRDPSGPPVTLIRPVLAENTPFGGLRRSSEGHGLPDLVLTATSWSDSWSIHILTWHRASSGLPWDPKGPVLAQNAPFCLFLIVFSSWVVPYGL